MNRKVGVGAIKKKSQETERFNAVGKSLEEAKLSKVRESFDLFKNNLHEFSINHRNLINSNPEFRYKFHQMCLSVGIDPLASNKSFWSNALGIGNYYFELSIVIIQICMKTRYLNGGIISLQDLLSIITTDSTHPNYKTVSIEDIIKSIDKIKVLGNGYRLLNIRGLKMLVSVPIELNKDHEDLLEVSQENLTLLDNNDSSSYLHVTEKLMNIHKGWSVERFQFAVRPLINEGILWIDIHEGNQ